MIHKFITSASLAFPDTEHALDLEIRYLHDSDEPSLHLVSIRIAVEDGWADAAWLEGIILSSPHMRQLLCDNAVQLPQVA